MHITSLSASPSERSRSAWLTQFALTRLEGRAGRHHDILVRALPAEALLSADVQDPAIAAAVQAVEAAELVIVSTPIYKAAYSGLLKVFLDLLPPDALRGKLVLPLATGGSPAHFLALDYALKPVLSALGARHVLDSVFATDAQLRRHEAGGYVPEPDLIARLDRALAPLTPRMRASQEDTATC
ncbi:NADPH-dependent FMN reductase [Roseateles puraquae]|uniref:FMN reductase (NADPH) n=1 Tax=Roseateles puraquae TaxID=431059 RepID=A0A254N6C7_9BURK|nr:NADPH-dependent FMN reductase [Roseateles puraquae]MDG0854277.1 FMN reductase (NADPH) [Roseateles puraquae]OWR03606.1 FMN reductase (NADPH) [Roseateles puraquae]